MTMGLSTVAIGLLPGNGPGARPAARLTLDRIDASARTVAGMLEELNDDIASELR